MLKAEISPETPSITYDQACTSALSTVKYGARSIKLGEAKIVMTGGSTSFSTVPFYSETFAGKEKAFFLYDRRSDYPLGYKDYAPL